MAVFDFHSHILPGADHGSANLDTSLAQLKLMSDMGTEFAVATPHFYPNDHTIASFSQRIAHSVEKLNGAAPFSAPALFLGAEVLVCRNLEKMDGLDSLCIKGTRVILLELPFEALTDRHVETVEALISDGYTVVLAHIDRYIKCYSDVIDEMLELGALAQINAQGLNSFSTKRKLMHYVKNTDRVCAIGSDLHGADQKDYKRFVSCKKILGEYFDVITSRTAELLKDAEPISFK